MPNQSLDDARALSILSKSGLDGEIPWEYDDVNGLIWDRGRTPAPTRAEIDAEIDKFQEQDRLDAHKHKRRRAYPKVGDQLDALYHAGIMPADLAAQIKAVKDKYPKAT